MYIHKATVKQNYKEKSIQNKYTHTHTYKFKLINFLN